MVLTLDFTCRTFFGQRDDAVFHWEDICFVSGSYPYTQLLSPVITEDMKFGSFWAHSQRSVQIDTRSSFYPAIRKRGTNFADTRLICKSSVKIFCPVPNAIPTSSATSLIVRRRSARMISCTRATVSSVWEVDGLPGWGSSSKDRRPFLKREYHSNVFNRLRKDSPKAACSISYVSAPVIPRRKQKLIHTCR